jgi:flagellar biosynthesis protein FliR
MTEDYCMRKRIAICLAFALVGLLFSFPVSDRFGVDLIWALPSGMLAGVFFGYMVSIMFDVFFGITDTEA